MIGKHDNAVERYHDLAAFVFSIVLLRSADYLRRLRLGEVVIFAQIPKSGLIIIHKFHLEILLYFYKYIIFRQIGVDFKSFMTYNMD